jgi:flagellar basal-body rod protein FlgB
MTTVAHKVSGLISRPDGNNVSLDRESMTLAETQMQFRVGIQFIRTEFHRILHAINEGKDS